MKLRSTLKGLFLPGIILQSVLIGGGYATGREIVEYGAKFGAMGWLSGIAIFLGFALISTLTIEACRQWQLYDYKSLLQKMIGRGWVLYEITYLMMAILTIAVMAAAAGEILSSTLGFNPWIGIVLIILIVGFMNYKGDEAIARFETIGTIALFAAYIVFSFSIFKAKSNEIVEVFQRWDTSYLNDVPALALVLWTGILYVGYNLGVYPASMFTYKNIQSKKQSIIAGLIAGLLMTFPWFLTYFAIMAFYPDEQVLAAGVPWLQMLQNFHPAFVIVFSVVVGWTLIETATGMIHGFIGRIEAEWKQKGRPLKKITKAYISLGALLAALLLSQIGIIDLVAKGYGLMAYALIAVYALPILFYSFKIMSGK